MKILVLSFHFKPDLCAGSFRSSAFVEQLQKITDKSIQIDVLTTRPNRYASYQVDALGEERSNNLSIHRFDIPKHASGMSDQALAFLSFARSVMRHVKGKKYDLVYATSSRLMVAALGAFVARHQRTKLYLDIRDLFVDTISDVFPRWLTWILVPWFVGLERWTFHRANHINIVSEGFTPYIKKRYPQKALTYFTNGIDPEFVKIEVPPLEARSPRALKRILYAGNIGEGQGLHWIIPHLAKRLEGIAEFVIIGDGGRRGVLEKLLLAHQCSSVTLLPPCDRQQLIQHYHHADVLFLHLNDYPAFRKVLPSKLFEYGAMGKPIWAGVAGYAAKFIQNELSHAVVFNPCDVDGAMSAWAKLIKESCFRESFIDKFQRQTVMKAMVENLVSTVM